METPTPDSLRAPRFTAWASACVELKTKKFFRSAAASSGISLEAAKQAARQLAKTRAEAAAAGLTPLTRDGQYPYPERVLVEPILDRVMGPGDAGPQEVARITRNSYDSKVLNAYHALFVDVDTETDSSNAGDEVVISQSAALDALIDLTRVRTDLQFRVYSTRAGLRYLCTSRLFDPLSADSQDILKRLKADKRYALLCRVQKCYRARLTPKPWRCYLKTEPRGFLGRLLNVPGSVTDPAKFATCRYIETVGAAQAVHPAIEPILRVHDQTSEATSTKPLA
ncbi:MAG: hypothetical protein ABW223_12360 [Rariglobus sp.]